MNADYRLDWRAARFDRPDYTGMKPMTSPRFVLCIRNEESDDLESRKVYQVLPDRAAARDGYVRVIDESGEDYLYPAEYFVPVRLPVAIAREVLWPPHEASQPTPQRLRRG